MLPPPALARRPVPLALSPSPCPLALQLAFIEFLYLPISPYISLQLDFIEFLQLASNGFSSTPVRRPKAAADGGAGGAGPREAVDAATAKERAAMAPEERMLHEWADEFAQVTLTRTPSTSPSPHRNLTPDPDPDLTLTLTLAPTPTTTPAPTLTLALALAQDGLGLEEVRRAAALFKKFDHERRGAVSPRSFYGVMQVRVRVRVRVSIHMHMLHMHMACTMMRMHTACAPY